MLLSHPFPYLCDNKTVVIFAAVERLFSGVGQDFAKQRQAMSEGTLESLIWARSYVKKKHKDEWA